MWESFMEIAFEAELNTEEHPELLEYAAERCNENPNTRQEAINDLRKMIFERGECKPHRTDDEFLLRFLRNKDFIVPRAHRLLVRYYEFREQNPHLYKDVDLWGLMRTGHIFEGCMLDRPDTGRLTIMRIGQWNPSEVPVEDLVRVGMIMAETGPRNPKIQVLGGTVLVDLEGLTMRQVSSLTPTIAYQIVSVLGGSFPVRVSKVHVINYNWLLNTFFYGFKKVIPQQAWDAIHFHGNDLTSLHKHIDPAALPPRYGGTCRHHATFAKWLQKIKKYRDENFDREMKELGYVIKE